MTQGPGKLVWVELNDVKMDFLGQANGTELFISSIQ